MRLEGRHISMLARVLRIVDTFDAMTSRRPYKEPIPPLKAMQIMVGLPPEKSDGNGKMQDERDRGMRRCFDEELLKKFILFLGDMEAWWATAAPRAAARYLRAAPVCAIMAT